MFQFTARLSGQRLSGAAVIAALFGACSTASAQLTTWVYDGADLQHVEEIGPELTWLSYGEAPTVDGTPVFDGLKLVGTGPDNQVFALTGDTYVASNNHDPNVNGFIGNVLTMYGHGTIDGTAWQHPGDKIRTIFAFGWATSGGVLNIYEVTTGFLLLDPNGGFVTGVGSGTSLGSFDPGGWGVGFAFEDRFGADITTAQNMYWTVTIKFDWTGMTPSDELSFNIPTESIHLQVMRPCPGDVNQDGIVDLSDLAALLSDYGCNSGWCPGDLDGNGVTDLSDLATVLGNYGANCL